MAKTHTTGQSRGPNKSRPQSTGQIDDQKDPTSPPAGVKKPRFGGFSRQLARRLFQLRYGLLVRWIGARAPQVDLSKKGAVIIQVDALGYDNLREAIDLGYMPFLKKLIDRGSFRLGRWRVGIPCDTPPVQAALMYGENDNVVGFYWLDKETGKRISCANPFAVKEIEEEIAGVSGSSIFAKGSTYGSIFTGKAFRSVMTVSALHPDTFGQRLGFRHLLLFALLNPIKALAIIGNSLFDVLLETADRIVVSLKDKPRRREGFMPLSRVFLNVIFREAASIGTRMDMYLGTPIVYAVFIGYDLVAHHSGPLSPNALGTLRGIDGCLRKINNVRGWCERDYDLYVLSDHGMTPSVPFGQAYGQTLAHYVAEVVEEPRLEEGGDPAEYHGGHMSSFLKDLSRYERNVGPALVPVLRLGAAVMKRWHKVPESEQPEKVTVVCCSSLAHVYCREPVRRLNLSEVIDLYPKLLPSLVDHDGVGLVIGLEGDAVVILSRKGRLVLGQERLLEGDNPLSQFEEPELAEKQIDRYARMSRCGDLVLFGALDGGKVICFENQLGSHGTIGGDQFYAFLLHPIYCDPELDKVTEARDLHHFFHDLAQKID